MRTPLKGEELQEANKISALPLKLVIGIHRVRTLCVRIYLMIFLSLMGLWSDFRSPEAMRAAEDRISRNKLIIRLCSFGDGVVRNCWIKIILYLHLLFHYHFGSRVL